MLVHWSIGLGLGLYMLKGLTWPTYYIGAVHESFQMGNLSKLFDCFVITILTGELQSLLDQSTLGLIAQHRGFLRSNQYVCKKLKRVLVSCVIQVLIFNSLLVVWLVSQFSLHFKFFFEDPKQNYLWKSIWLLMTTGTRHPTHGL